MHSPFAASVRIVVFLLWTLLLIPPYAALLGLGRIETCHRLACRYWRGAAWIVGFNIVVRGTMSTERPVLFVSNHASYLDIIVLGGLLDAAFVAKKEVGQWPGIGILAKLGRTVFVDRRPRKSLEQRNEMLARLGGTGESLILFPEGTSNDGNRVLPFKSALLSVAETIRVEGKPLSVQPLSLAYTRLDGMPIGNGWRAFYAWYGDMTLLPHLWTFLGLGTTTVEIDFHPVVTLEQFGSRKALADHCHDVIARGVVLANAGRVPVVVAVEPATVA